MPVDAAILGFSHRWHAAMMGRAIEVTVAPGRVVRVVSPPYLLATKLEAFANRGEGDYLFSQDIGDIVALVDGRHELVNEVHEEGRDAREFVARDPNCLAVRHVRGPVQARRHRPSVNTPSVGTLQRYAKAVGCELKIELVAGSG